LDEGFHSVSSVVCLAASRASGGRFVGEAHGPLPAVFFLLAKSPPRAFAGRAWNFIET
jgi:hypothetical protein